MDETKFAALYMRFERGVPNESKLDEVEKKIQQYSSLSYDIDTLRKAEPTQKENKLRQRFVHHIPTREEMIGLERRAEQYKAAEDKFNSLSGGGTGGASTVAAEPKKASNKLYIVLAILSAIFLVGGIAAIFFNLVAGIILLVFGVIGLAVAGFLYLNKKTNSTKAVGQGGTLEDPLKLSARKSMESALNEIQAFLMPYGYSLNNGVAYAVAMFREDVKSYIELLAADEENAHRIENKFEKRQKLGEEITAFFAGYKVTGENFVRQLADLRSDINTYQALRLRRELSADNESRLQERIAQNRRIIADFCKKYHFDIELISEKIKQLVSELKELSLAQKTLKEQTEKTVRYKNEKRLSKRPEGQIVDLKALNEQLADLQERKNSLLSEITGDEYEVEKLDDLRNELIEAKENLEGYKRTHELLCRTMDALKQADKRLKDKYAKPIKDKFVSYASILERALGEKIVMGADFEVRYERNGRERSEKHLSSGQRSICALCFRLALIDNMYSEEKPFLILDDPFVNLDEEHMKKVRAMLKELSQKLQIIYFSCHPSRAM